MSKTKSDKITLPPKKQMIIAILYLIILIIRSYVLLGGFKLGDEVLDVYGVDKKILECRSDEDFMLYDKHEF